jgi:hypothetical protein
MLSFVGYLGAASMIALAMARIMMLSSVVKPVSAPPIGEYRVIYEFDKEEVRVCVIDKRNDGQVYRSG